MLTAAIYFLTLISVSYVQADKFCGTTLCTGDGVYCCGIYNDVCCWATVSVVGFWWFWFIWVCVFVGILSCSIWICIRRRRRASAGYIIVNQQPTYGSATSVTTYPTVTASAPAYQR